MQHAGQLAMRNASIIEKISRRRRGRRSLFTHILEALHASRRRDARNLLRRYRHLIAEDFQSQPICVSPKFNSEESIVNANRDQKRARPGHRTLQSV
jgi:hypothetical protein